MSPETARKAIIVLVDLEIVKAKHGSGFYVASKEKAQDFVTQYQDVQTIAEIKEELLNSVAKQKEELTHFSSILDTLVEQTKRFDSFNPMNPYSLVLTEEAAYLEATISEMNFGKTLRQRLSPSNTKKSFWSHLVHMQRFR